MVTCIHAHVFVGPEPDSCGVFSTCQLLALHRARCIRGSGDVAGGAIAQHYPAGLGCPETGEGGEALRCTWGKRSNELSWTRVQGHGGATGSGGAAASGPPATSSLPTCQPYSCPCKRSSCAVRQRLRRRCCSRIMALSVCCLFPRLLPRQTHCPPPLKVAACMRQPQQCLLPNAPRKLLTTPQPTYERVLMPCMGPRVHSSRPAHPQSSPA